MKLTPLLIVQMLMTMVLASMINDPVIGITFCVLNGVIGGLFEVVFDSWSAQRQKK